MDVSGIKSIARSARPQLESHLNCRPINQAICEALQEAGVECEVVDGHVTRYELRGEGPAHSFVIVTDEAVTTPLIVDGALDQFCEENREKGFVTFSLGSKTEIPEIVVTTRGEDYYENYSW